jgi:hypothetical protein
VSLSRTRPNQDHSGKMVAVGYYVETIVFLCSALILLTYGFVQCYLHLWRHQLTPNPKIRRIHKVIWVFMLIGGLAEFFQSLDIRGVLGIYPIWLVPIFFTIVSTIDLLAILEWVFSLVSSLKVLQTRDEYTPDYRKNSLVIAAASAFYISCYALDAFLFFRNVRFSMSLICWIMVNSFTLVLEYNTMKGLYAFSIEKQNNQSFSTSFMEHEVRRFEEMFLKPVSRLLLTFIFTCVGISVNIGNLVHFYRKRHHRNGTQFISVSGYLIFYMVSIYVSAVAGILLSWVPLNSEEDMVSNTASKVLHFVWKKIGCKIFPNVEPVLPKAGLIDSVDQIQIS